MTPNQGVVVTPIRGVVVTSHLVLWLHPRCYGDTFTTPLEGVHAMVAPYYGVMVTPFAGVMVSCHSRMLKCYSMEYNKYSNAFIKTVILTQEYQVSWYCQ